jgi:hypothetical protein
MNNFRVGTHQIQPRRRQRKRGVDNSAKRLIFRAGFDDAQKKFRFSSASSTWLQDARRMGTA